MFTLFLTDGDGKVEVMRSCGDVFHGAALEGCFDLKGYAGNDDMVNS